MKVKELKELLANYEDETHVVVAVLPNDALPMVVQVEGRKMEITECWADGFGVLNLIANHQGGDLDPNLRTKNELK